MTNHLSAESSPYLLQHAGNPVDWYPWGAEALEKARTEDKPIFLSIGYSACHWCHVMERESFEDEATAARLNEHFVSIKVDREERPDLDAVYMEAVRVLTGQGGWPLSVWLTPESVPFFGGTYFPPAPRTGLPSFRQVLEAVSEAWHTRRADLDQTAAAVRDHLATDREERPEGRAAASAAEVERAGIVGRAGLDRPRILAAAVDSLHRTADRVHGGWDGAPKFPAPLVLEYLLAQLAVATRPEVEVDVVTTLDAMAAGGLYDHLGGGFHRYSTDENWLIPHFEKMLYDNAQLARCYLHAWQLLGKSRYRVVAVETLDYLLREMRHPRGGFFSAQDADTEQGEGAYFAWTIDEVRRTLPPEEAALIERTYGLASEGNFEGRNILRLPAGPSNDRADRTRPGPKTSPTGQDAGADPVLNAARSTLLQTRETRPRPARDEKIIAGWNGLALAALAEAAVAFDSPVYRDAAEQTGDFLLGELCDAGRLAHSWKDGRISGGAFLDDYACVAEGLLALYGCTLDERWFVAARALADGLAERFRRQAGGFYDTSVEHESLIARPRATYDSPTPTGNSMTATILLKLSALTGDDGYRQLAEEALDSLAAEAAAAPVMSGQWLSAALLAEEGPTEVAIVGDLGRRPGRELLAAVRTAFRPLMVYAARPAATPTQIPLLFGREPGPGDPAAAWLCTHSTCAPPTSDPAELLRLLGSPQLTL